MARDFFLVGYYAIKENGAVYNFLYLLGTLPFSLKYVLKTIEEFLCTTTHGSNFHFHFH
jgi:hypothetical protein